MDLEVKKLLRPYYPWFVVAALNLFHAITKHIWWCETIYLCGMLVWLVWCWMLVVSLSKDFMEKLKRDLPITAQEPELNTEGLPRASDEETSNPDK